MSKRVPEARTLGGMWKAGDVAVRPPDTCVEVNNMLVRPGRIAGRPPFTYDNLMAINGLANFQDPVNRVSRLMAVDTTHHLFEKATTGEVWSGALGTVGGSRLSGYANYLGKVWMMLDDGAGLPSAAASFDGTNISISPFTSAIQGRDVIPFGERLVIIYPRVVVTNAVGAVANAYDWTNAITWPKVFVTASNLTIGGGKTVCRLFPTSTNASACSVSFSFAGSGVVALADSVTDQPYELRHDIGSVDPSYEVPMTYEVSLQQNGVFSAPRTFVVGDMLTRNGFIQRCTTAGTENAAEPAWNATKGGTTAWDGGGLIFTNIGSTTLASVEFDLPTATDAAGQPYTVYLPIVVPWGSSAAGLGMGLNITLKLYNSTRPALTVLAPIDISLKDGLTDGDARKANRGFQVTKGEFPYPFFNQETTLNASTVDINAIIYSEIRQPMAFRATNDYRVNELVGLPTGAAVNSKRLIVFWSRGFAQFTSNTDDNFPLRLERLDSEFGCLGPLAKDTFMNTTFFVAEDDVYAYQAGSGDPLSILGDGMREVVMDHGAGWVNNPALDTNRPILKIDKLLKIVYVYTQRGKLFAFNMVTKAWSTLYVSNGAEINAMLWNQNTGRFYVSFAGFGLALFDFSLSANDTVDNVGTGGAIDMNIVHIMESETGVRTDTQAEMIQALYRSDIDQTGQVVTVSVSTDQGATYPHATQVTPVLVSTAGNYLPLPITTRLSPAAPSLTFKIARSGKGGEKSWSLSTRLRIDVEQTGTPGTPERTMTNPTAGTAS